MILTYWYDNSDEDHDYYNILIESLCKHNEKMFIPGWPPGPMRPVQPVLPGGP